MWNMQKATHHYIYCFSLSHFDENINLSKNIATYGHEQLFCDVYQGQHPNFQSIFLDFFLKWSNVWIFLIDRTIKMPLHVLLENISCVFFHSIFFHKVCGMHLICSCIESSKKKQKKPFISHKLSQISVDHHSFGQVG